MSFVHGRVSFCFVCCMTSVESIVIVLNLNKEYMYVLLDFTVKTIEFHVLTVRKFCAVSPSYR